MTEPADYHPANADPPAPKALVDDLNALFGASVPVPREVDETVAAMAREQLSRRARPRRLLPWAAALAAAAAVLLLAWTVKLFEREAPAHAAKTARPATLLPSHPQPPTPDPQPLDGDINGDGRVNILDAFALARQLEAAQALKGEWDFNRDGVVDRRDAEALAQAAVKLATHPPQARKPPGG